MAKGVSRYLNTTVLASIPARTLSASRIRQRRSNATRFENNVISNCGSGIVQVIRHRAPRLTDDLMRQVETDQPEYITRHIEERFLSSARTGYFQFGSLVKYRAKEGTFAGRFGDHQESRVQEIFNSRSEFFERASLEGIEIINNSFSGTKRHVVVETIVNDFCSCSSIGKFSLERGIVLRDREIDPDKKPGAYVTYHLPTLRLALHDYFSQSPDLSGHILLGRKVKYGEKDRSWEVEQNFIYQPDRDAMAIWLSIAFVKSPTFEHEQEYRLLLLDPSVPGGLADDTGACVIAENSAIAASIFASDTY